MRLSLRHNVKQVRRDLSDAARRQLPFAVAVMLNDVAAQVKTAGERAIVRRLDRPTAFTRRAFMVLRARKSALAAEVRAKRIQADYLATQEFGGTRRAKRKARPVPTTVRRNKFGNLSRREVQKLLSKKNVFSGVPKGGGRPGGIYQRLGASSDRPGGYDLRLLVTWSPRQQYRPRLGFLTVARRTAQAEAPRAMDRAFRKAWATRRS